MGTVEQYLDYTRKYKEQYGEKTCVLMQVGSFYELYALHDTETNNSINLTEITEQCRTTDLNIVSKKQMINNYNVMMAGFHICSLDKYLRKFKEADYIVIVISQEGEGPNPTRKLDFISSPGTYFSSEPSQITNNTICIWLDKQEHSTNRDTNRDAKIMIGMANIDIITGKSNIFEYIIEYFKNPTTFDDLERFVSIYKPSETIIISNLDDHDTNMVVNYLSLNDTTIHIISLLKTETESLMVLNALNAEKQAFQFELLRKFYNPPDISVFYETFYYCPFATKAFCFLLNFIYEHNPNLVDNISEPIFDNHSKRLVLANHSLKQLNIIDDGQSKHKLSSVAKYLNKTVTSMGKRRFNYNLLNPTNDIDWLTKEYNIIEYLLTIEPTVTFMRTQLTNLRDIEKLNRKLFIKKITPQEICFFYTNLENIQLIYEYLKTDVTINNYFATKVIENILDYSVAIHSSIEKTMDIEKASLVDSLSFDENFINRGVNDDLDEINQDLYDNLDVLKATCKYLNNLIINTEKNSRTHDFVKLHLTDKFGYSIIATKKRCVTLKHKLKEFIESTKTTQVSIDYVSSYNNISKSFNLQLNNIDSIPATGSNDSIVSSQIKSICLKINENKIKMKDYINLVYTDFINNLQKFQNEIHTIVEYVMTLDVISTKAFISVTNNYCKPVITEKNNSFVDIKGLRHPLIEQLQINEIYITNDIGLGGDRVTIPHGVLLYGTNAVGKTSLIRAMGISVIMAQAGLYVPCTQFTFSPYQYIFTRILGNDNLFKGLSTFAVEMSELRMILKYANNKSLILGDELCSGTESDSAISIFIAGLLELHKKNCSFIFATHFHEIVNLEEIKNMEKLVLKHMTVIYDKETDKLIYDRKLKDGPGDSMYGLEVCKSLNLPPEFLELAYSLRLKYNTSIRGILSLDKSGYNSKKLKGICELCNENIGSEIHHLQYQQDAEPNGYIGTFHKNHLANLISICKICHQKIHKENIKYIKQKTSNGYELVQKE